MTLFVFIALLFVGGIVAWLSERVHVSAPRWVSIGVIFIAGLWLAVYALQGPMASDSSLTGGLYDAVNVPWIPRFGISLHLAMDGLSLMLVVLTVFLGLVAVLSSWTEIEFRPGAFQFNILWTLAGVVGVFTAVDLFLFFFFWEVMLIPMYFLIAVWGHENRRYAAMKFFLFTQISGLALLLAILALAYANYSVTGTLTFDYEILRNAQLPPATARWLMLGFFIAFIVKLPAVPFHTWLPDAHTQAPTAGSVLLAGILLKTGAYGLLRFVIPLFEEAAMDFRVPAMLLGTISIIYGGYMAYSQTDFKRLVAYSSVSHMGFVLLGVFAWNQLALQGAVVQMLAHGFSSAALFMLAGALQQRLHTRELSAMGGLWAHAPRMGVVTLFFVVASLGMPGLGTFIGEFLVLLGAFQVNVALTVVAAIGIIVAAVYSLSLMQRSFQGPANADITSMTDFGARELGIMIVMALALVWLGVAPQVVLDLAEPVIAGLGVMP
jgi:NADH-quinone oxidoreductase subunit M